MTLALVIVLPLALVVVYGFWLANQLGRGPTWRRRALTRHAAGGTGDEFETEQNVPNSQ